MINESEIKQKKIKDLTIEEFVSIFSKYDICRGYNFMISFAELMEQDSKILEIVTKDFIALNCIMMITKTGQTFQIIVKILKK